MMLQPVKHHWLLIWEHELLLRQCVVFDLLKSALPCHFYVSLATIVAYGIQSSMAHTLCDDFSDEHSFFRNREILTHLAVRFRSETTRRVAVHSNENRRFWGDTEVILDRT